MRYKKIYYLIGIIIILLIIIVILNRPRQPRLLLGNQKLSGIIIERPNDTTEIKITMGHAQLIRPIDYPADSGFVFRMVNQLRHAELGEVISEKENRYKDFEVSDKDMKVTLKTRRPISFYIGKYAADFQHAYFRFVGDKKVHLVSGISKYTFDRSPDDWRDKLIISFEKNDVTKLKIKGNEIVKKDTLWFLNEKEIDKNEMDTVLQLFSNLHASGFIDTLKFEPEWSAEVYLKDLTYRLLVGKKCKKMYYAVKLEGLNPVFLVNEAFINRLTGLIK